MKDSWEREVRCAKDILGHLEKPDVLGFAWSVRRAVRY